MPNYENGPSIRNPVSAGFEQREVLVPLQGPMGPPGPSVDMTQVPTIQAHTELVARVAAIEDGSSLAFMDYLDMRGLAVLFEGSNNVAVNDRARLITAIQRAESKNLPLMIAPGHHSILGGGVQAEAQSFRVYGAGAAVSILDFNLNGTAKGVPAFKIGPDSAGGPGVGPGDWPGGFVQDFSIWNNWQSGYLDTPAFEAGPIGLQLSQAHPDVIRMDVRGFNVPYDMWGNCYGTRWASCWAKYGWNNYGMLIREGDQNGQDHTFDNCWLGGRKGGVVIAGWGAGYTFHGGQFGHGTAAGAGVINDRASLMLGVGWYDDRDNPVVIADAKCGSNRNVTIQNVNFESPIGGWAIFATEPQHAINFGACHFMGGPIVNDPSNPIGVLKAINAFDGSMFFRGCSIHRNWHGVSNPYGDDGAIGGPHLAAVSYGALADPLYVEEGTTLRDARVNTLDVGQTSTLFAGRGMLAEAGVPHHGPGRNGQQQIGPMRLRGNANGTLERSMDYGVTWAAV